MTQPYEVVLGTVALGTVGEESIADLVTAPQPRQIRIRAVGD